MTSDGNLLEIFRREAEDNLAKLEELLGGFDPAEPDTEQIDALFRTAHNLKGSAHTAGCRSLGELAHVVEELIDRWRDGRLEPTRAQIDWATSSVDALRAELRMELDGAAVEEASAGGASSEEESSLRVSVRQLDEIVDTISQIVVDRSRMEAWIERGEGTASELRDAFEQSQPLYTDLRDRVFSLRMTAVAPMFRRLERAAQDVAKKLGKSIDVQFVGEGLELDATLIDGLKDPLNHMIRNAVDHGVELPEAREAAGKPRQGTVQLRASRLGGVALFQLSDDGAGLNREKIAKKAREVGRDVDAASLTSRDLADFIFQAGFSTADAVTDISGRGVGMDVVKRNIEALRGDVSVESEQGHGTTFSIRVPLSLAILDGLHFVAGGRTFVLPSEQVEECIEARAPGAEGARVDVFEVRGEPVSRIHVAGAFGLASSPSRRSPALLVHDGTRRVALGVDRIVGERQTVLEPLGPLFEANRPIAGATVLGTGEVAIVLDLHKLIDSVRQRAA